jgi:predicted amidophosphoribosyltransferase
MPINEECPGQMGHLQIGKHVGTGIVNKKDNRNNLSSQQRRISELIYSRWTRVLTRAMVVRKQAHQSCSNARFMFQIGGIKMANEKVCPKCGLELQGWVEVCPDCGSALLELKIHCRSCGNELPNNKDICMSCGVRPPNGDKFCPRCGASVLPEAEICIKCKANLVKEKPLPASFNISLFKFFKH